ncbi:MAG: Rne/Rng family ribonuclease [Planctomycetota bacterium]
MTEDTSFDQASEHTPGDDAGTTADAGTTESSAAKKKTTKKASKKTTKKKTAKTASKKKTTKKASKKTSKKTTKKVAVADEPAETEEVAEPVGLAADTDTEMADDGSTDETVDEPHSEPVAEAGESSEEGGSGAEPEAAEESASDDGQDDDPSTKKNAKRKTRKKTSRRNREDEAGAAPQALDDDDDTAAVKRGPKPETRLVVNYIPGEECRVALLEDGKLQEYEAERFDKISRVGNIYLGRVTNVEAGIQAAFVDFGVEEAGFLHVSDLHPSLFPGAEDEATERVGKKTPRRDRPPIEKALKKGQLILVQVLKDGVGTKGPALTAYLSIPGRFLVMMPQMDKVGVSRKVEDEDLRKRMRKILDQLELPDGFGFILRTAGLERTKTELKRDLAYLQRLWKDMEKRRKGARGPKLLYSESDLLLRTLRDQLTTDIDDLVIDSERALERAGQFLKIVAPRTRVGMKRYTGALPVFDAFGVEEQIAQMHAREVPLPSGGRLVIDQTEALLAIDVNSGRMRSKDADMNALRCNLEAADEICRQLRLRDMGGLVINDLIDMRQARHRKEVEQRFKDNLKRDKAKSTLLQISQFGIMEMTRQRMVASHESRHFTTCPMCNGRGLVQRPGSAADDALRAAAAVLASDRVHKAELIVSPRLAGELLSAKRRSLARIERQTGKVIEVRVGDNLRIDQYRLYGYEPNGNDVDLERLPKPPSPLKQLETYEIGGADDEAWAVDPDDEAAELAPADDEEHHDEPPLPGGDDEGSGKKKRRRRRRRRGKGGGEDAGEEGPRQSEDADASDEETESRDTPEGDVSDEDGEGKKKRRRRRRRRGKGGGDASEENAETVDNGDSTTSNDPQEGGESTVDDVDDESARGDRGADDAAEEGEGKKKRRRRRRRRGKGGGDASEENAEQTDPGGSSREQTYRGADGRTATDGDAKTDEPAVTVKPARSLYRSSRRKLAPSEISRLGMED